jgi:hypothetical protein
MAAVILEFVSRQVEERSDIGAGKSRAIAELFSDLAKMPGLVKMPNILMANEGSGSGNDEMRLTKLIEALYEGREVLGEPAFTQGQSRIRRALRELLDLDLKIAGKAES